MNLSAGTAEWEGLVGYSPTTFFESYSYWEKSVFRPTTYRDNRDFLVAGAKWREKKNLWRNRVKILLKMRDK